jgi:predicted nucleotidyltransferase component of viral defense system
VKDFLADRLRTLSDPAQSRNLVREYLQARILAVLQRSGAMVPLAFHGGTALRFLYASARYSEDLDFTLEGRATDYDLRSWLEDIRTELAGEGYRLAIKISDTRVVHGAFLRFHGLLHELELSQHRDEALSIKLEVDTRPPAVLVSERSGLARTEPGIAEQCAEANAMGRGAIDSRKLAERRC